MIFTVIREAMHNSKSSMPACASVVGWVFVECEEVYWGLTCKVETFALVAFCSCHKSPLRVYSQKNDVSFHVSCKWVCFIIILSLQWWYSLQWPCSLCTVSSLLGWLVMHPRSSLSRCDVGSHAVLCDIACTCVLLCFLLFGHRGTWWLGFSKWELFILSRLMAKIVVNFIYLML